MGPFLIRRFLLALPVIFGVVTLVFLFIHLIPGDPIQILLGENAAPADVASLRAALGLDQPLLKQYGLFLKGLVHGDLGTSIHSKRKVVDHIRERFPATLELALAAMSIAILISIPLGIISAMKSHTLIDRSSMFLALLGISIPNFWLGPMLIIIFSIKLDLLPVTGRGSISHLILPAFTLGASFAALLTRMTRSTMLEVLRADYITTARAKGLSEFTVVVKHALRNALIPIVTIIGLQFGALLGGSIITEKVFSWPGVGRLMIDSIQRRDYPVVQGCILVIALTYVVINLLTDILYAALDPRIRLVGGES